MNLIRIVDTLGEAAWIDPEKVSLVERDGSGSDCTLIHVGNTSICVKGHPDDFAENIMQGVLKKVHEVRL